jgi:hypothetical protein
MGLERFEGYFKACPDGGGIRAKWRKSIRETSTRINGIKGLAQYCE